jgi:hypothetical protein
LPPAGVHVTYPPVTAYVTKSNFANCRSRIFMSVLILLFGLTVTCVTTLTGQ